VIRIVKGTPSDVYCHPQPRKTHGTRLTVIYGIYILFENQKVFFNIEMYQRQLLPPHLGFPRSDCTQKASSSSCLIHKQRHIDIAGIQLKVDIQKREIDRARQKTTVPGQTSPPTRVCMPIKAQLRRASSASSSDLHPMFATIDGLLELTNNHGIC
jgi:hypothetical protein